MESDFQKVLGHALLHTEFRDAITSQDADTQRAALEGIGIADASDELLTALNNAVDALDDLSNAFDPIKHAAT
jgi:hypothetical protein